jgi:hypothetical protein
MELIACLLSLAAVLAGGPHPARADGCGDPLPLHAVARLGTARDGGDPGAARDARDALARLAAR